MKTKMVPEALIVRVNYCCKRVEMFYSRKNKMVVGIWKSLVLEGKRGGIRIRSGHSRDSLGEIKNTATPP